MSRVEHRIHIAPADVVRLANAMTDFATVSRFDEANVVLETPAHGGGDLWVSFGRMDGHVTVTFRQEVPLETSHPPIIVEDDPPVVTDDDTPVIKGTRVRITHPNSTFLGEVGTIVVPHGTSGPNSDGGYAIRIDGRTSYLHYPRRDFTVLPEESS